MLTEINQAQSYVSHILTHVEGEKHYVVEFKRIMVLTSGKKNDRKKQGHLINGW